MTASAPTTPSIRKTEDLMIKPGMRLISAVCTTEVVVVHVADPAVVIECGGLPMLPAGSAGAAGVVGDKQLEGGTLIGKRYGGPEVGVEVLCVKAGSGTLSADGVPLRRRESKPLPASD